MPDEVHVAPVDFNNVAVADVATSEIVPAATPAPLSTGASNTPTIDTPAAKGNVIVKAVEFEVEEPLKTITTKHNLPILQYFATSAVGFTAKPVNEGV